MRFISCAPGHKKAVVKPKRTLVNTDNGPEYTESERGYIAFFRQGGATQREIELALDRFKFTGTYEGENPTRRISIYDTDEQARAEGWDDDFKAKVEKALVDGQNQWYFLVEQLPAPKPWPSYDETAEKDILAVAEVTGVSLEAVAAYERENKKRKSILDKLEKPVDDEVTVPA